MGVDNAPGKTILLYKRGVVRFHVVPMEGVPSQPWDMDKEIQTTWAFFGGASIRVNTTTQSCATNAIFASRGPAKMLRIAKGC